MTKTWDIYGKFQFTKNDMLVNVDKPVSLSTITKNPLILVDVKFEENQNIQEWLVEEPIGDITFEVFPTTKDKNNQIIAKLSFDNINDAIKFKFDYGDYLHKNLENQLRQ